MIRAWRQWVRKLAPGHRATAAARQAALRGDWPTAAAALARAVAARPRRADLLVQYGHALKESGRREEAVDAYSRAADALPGDLDVRTHLAALLRESGRLSETARVYAAMLTIDPLHLGATQGLAELGAREALPDAALTTAVQHARIARVVTLRTALARAEEAVAVSAFPVSRYAEFRRTFPLAPPAGACAPLPAVLVLAQTGSAAMLRVSLDALVTGRAFERIVVAAPPGLHGHPVASVGACDPRVLFVEPADVERALGPADRVLVTAAGTVLDPHGAAWLAHAAARTGANAVYGDHDRWEPDWRGDGCLDEPVLFGAHDAVAIRAATQPPAAVLVTVLTLRRVGEQGSGGNPVEMMRALVLSADAAVHVPRRIASLYRPPAPARAAPADADVAAVAQRVQPIPATVRPPAPVAVIIPTRDEAAMVSGFVESLGAMADHPSRVQPIILDNRSVEPGTVSVLAALVERGARVCGFDEPFNWSRINNRGAAACDAPLLVFANNDMTMLSPGWDSAVERELARPEVGAVGARLLYPDGDYQHAGVLFGLHGARLAVHEGLGHRSDEGGPGGRWRTTRVVSAVTGAFIATSRDTFAALRGFEEALAVAYNDIDYCLRVRERGSRVLYVPGITLTHHESLTRGRNVTQSQVAWDEGELAVLARRWGGELQHDPGYNPQWALRGEPFDGFREPDPDELTRWIDRGAGGNPWLVRRTGN